MHLAKVRKNLVYRHSPRLRMDVYRPRRASGRLPTVLLGRAKDSAQKIGWSQLIAASGMAAVAFDYVSADDRGKALAYVRAHARKLGIDGGRVCTMWFSSAPALSQAVRCSVVYYAPLDSTLKYPPLLVVKAGRDDSGINDSIDRFEAAARELHGDVRVVSNATARHGFDLGPRTARTRAITAARGRAGGRTRLRPAAGRCFARGRLVVRRRPHAVDSGQWRGFSLLSRIFGA